MDRVVYTALTAMQRTNEMHNVTANNLANVSTPGFRREMVALSSGWLSADGTQLTARVQSGGEAPFNLSDKGRIEVTGRPLDISIDGDAWLQVEDESGTPALTRRGDLHVDDSGRLLTGSGHVVQGNLGGAIQLPADFNSVRISRNGVLEILPPDDTVWVEVGRLNLMDAPPETLSRGEDGLFRSDQASNDPDATVRVGAIEQSNMNPTQALVELVQTSRMFELQTKLLSAAKEMDEGTAALMRINS